MDTTDSLRNKFKQKTKTPPPEQPSQKTSHVTIPPTTTNTPDTQTQAPHHKAPKNMQSTNPMFKSKAPKKEEPKIAKSPEQIWLDRAEEAKLTREKATHIVAEILRKGRYTESFALQDGTTLVLTTRSGADRRRINEYVNLNNPKTPEYWSDLSFRCSAAASILSLGEIELKHETADDFNENLKWIDSLPEPLLLFISNKINLFDTQVSLASEKIGVENF